MSIIGYISNVKAFNGAIKMLFSSILQDVSQTSDIRKSGLKRIRLFSFLYIWAILLQKQGNYQDNKGLSAVLYRHCLCNFVQTVPICRFFICNLDTVKR